ncbi:hypothetical protein MLD38_031019 [Melastoma candidum]|uniref:Uncharacterized protein n=1 Tax=Melastoma candidum TaxID=119954 RepID=A0ACB9MPZ7_9MYRT|nr:hypothetical protein MLD38_031019 [Melastoma candidum]
MVDAWCGDCKQAGDTVCSDCGLVPRVAYLHQQVQRQRPRVGCPHQSLLIDGGLSRIITTGELLTSSLGR